MNKIRQYDIVYLTKTLNSVLGLGGLQYDGKLIVSKSPTIARLSNTIGIIKIFISYINNCENNIKNVIIILI